MYPFSKIEKKWQKKWLASGIYEPDLKRAKKPFYNLMMFPYPSAEGLHVGNMYAFTGTDVYGRMKRMQGYDVFEPIGLDGFGIHSENYALKVGTHPAKQAEISEKRFYKQLESIGNGFAWREKLETYDPAYYRWTQWIFIQLFKSGLAYRKKQAVNWCPSCKTVLADEQVIAGECERCSSIVVKKELEQWFLRITAYAEKLLKNLDKIDWSEKVKIAQRNWIGKSEGALVKFQISNFQYQIEVFTTRPDTLFGATYMVLAPEHPLIDKLKVQISNFREVEKYIKKARLKSESGRIAEQKEKTGVELKGINAVNPATGGKITVWVADYVVMGYGTGAIMAVPAHDERDFEFAKKFGLPVVQVIRPPVLIAPPVNAQTIASGGQAEIGIESECWTGDGMLMNSGKFNGMDSEETKSKIVEFAGGKLKSTYHLRDWLISRQRYWGPPIPMIFCEKCAAAGKGEREDMPGWYTVPEKDMPVKLPYVKDFRPTGTDHSPLATVESFYKVRCPKCKFWAHRETDVSDTFLDSAWYYLRFPSIKEKTKPWNTVTTKKWLPVNIYIGGVEHSVLHLLYVRFVAMALHDAGLISFEEPFPKFRAHGLIIKDGAKMSKSKGNVVNPDEYIKNFGADALRMYLMFLGPFEDGGDFGDTGIQGITRFLNRVWAFSKKTKFNKNGNGTVERALHRTIKKVTEDIENLGYNTAISALMILLHDFEDNAASVSRAQFGIFLELLAPFAPHITEELWDTLVDAKGSVHTAPWPKYDAGLMAENFVDLVVQVNGKFRMVIRARRGVSQNEAERLALAEPRLRVVLDNKRFKRVIFVRDRLINFVI